MRLGEDQTTLRKRTDQLADDEELLRLTMIGRYTATEGHVDEDG
jgi:hypothetical protein